MKVLATFLLITTAICSAQTTPGTLSFSLPEHAGKLSLDQGALQIEELSAKPNGREWGIRAEDHDLHFLGFLFVWPEEPNLNAASCRDEMLKKEGPASEQAATNRLQLRSSSGVDIAIALMIPKDASSSAVRAFVASGDLCGDLTFSSPHPVTEQSVPMHKVKDFLLTLKFDPQAKPSFRDAFAYATVEFDHHQYVGAATAYQAALKLIDTSDDPIKWRRVATDQLSISLGISGDLAQSRAVNEAAIVRDPTYPLYYYNLACADAEQGNASAARVHLQQAFDRKANALPGESLPDPTTDDSIRKLKSDPAFWTFAQSLTTTGKP
jgi:tetratricopeptide (TPR) repeat protein